MATKEIKEGIYASALKKDNAELTKQNNDLMKKYKMDKKTKRFGISGIYNREF